MLKYELMKCRKTWQVSFCGQFLFKIRQKTTEKRYKLDKNSETAWFVRKSVSNVTFNTKILTKWYWIGVKLDCWLKRTTIFMFLVYFVHVFFLTFWSIHFMWAYIIWILGAGVLCMEPQWTRHIEKTRVQRSSRNVLSDLC